MSCKCTFELKVGQSIFPKESESHKYENIQCEEALEFFKTLNNSAACNPLGDYWAHRYTVKYQFTQGDKTLANASEETPDLVAAKLYLFMKDQTNLPKTKNDDFHPSLHGYWNPLSRD